VAESTRQAGGRPDSPGPATPVLSPDDKQLAAALTLLGDRINPIIEEVLAGEFDTDERKAFAKVLATIAGNVDPDLRV
jgi:hypothetical protein